MKVGLFVNDAIPGMGLPCSGQGIRAWGLLQGLREIGVDAYAIMRHSMVSARIRRWPDIRGFKLPEHIVIVNHVEMPRAIAEFDYVIFHNWAGGAGIEKPENSDVRFVYDFFSATLIEHSFISSDPSYLDDILSKKVRLIEQSDIFIANGVGRRAYAAKFLANLGIESPVHDIPTCLPWLGIDEMSSDILVGGYQQNWTEQMTTGALADLSTHLPGHELITVGADTHYHFGARTNNNEAIWTDTVVPYDILSFEDYAGLNACAAAFVDVSPMNEERQISFSTRGVLSIACGCPIVHNAESDLGGLIAKYDAGSVLNESDDLGDPAQLSYAIADSLDPQKRKNCRTLWAQMFDCNMRAMQLVEVFQNA